MRPEDDAKNTRWTFRKDVSVGNVISMAGLVIGLFAWGNSIERRIIVLEERAIVSSAANDRQTTVIRELKEENRQRLDRIEDKLEVALAAMRSEGRTIPIIPQSRPR